VSRRKRNLDERDADVVHCARCWQQKPRIYVRNGRLLLTPPRLMRAHGSEWYANAKECYASAARAVCVLVRGGIACAQLLYNQRDAWRGDVIHAPDAHERIFHNARCCLLHGIADVVPAH